MAFLETDSAQPTRHNPYLHEIVLGELKKQEQGLVLDIPSGPGYLARDLKAMGFDAVAGEIDERLHCFEDVTYSQTDMTRSLPFADGHFNYVTSIEGIEHIDNHFAFLKEVARVLKPGGCLYLTTPNIHTLESRWNFFLSGFHLLAPKPIPLDTENIYFEHINPISLNQLYFYCARVGLNVEKVKTHRFKKGSRLFYWLLYPFIRWATYSACFLKEKDPIRRESNRAIYQFLKSPENLLGSHTIIVARKVY